MSEFKIVRETAGRLAPKLTEVMTSVGEHAGATVEFKQNIGAKLSGFFHRPILRSIGAEVVPAANSPELDHAIRALHELAAPFNVTGIALHDGFYGGIKFADQPTIFTSGAPTLERLGGGSREMGRAVAETIDQHARAVMELLGQ